MGCSNILARPSILLLLLLPVFACPGYNFIHCLLSPTPAHGSQLVDLAGATLIPLPANGPETLAVDSEAKLRFGLDDGGIYKLSPTDGELKLLANTGGRPLGSVYSKAGDLIVADVFKGLLEVSPDGTMTTLSRRSEGLAFGFTNDVAVAADGTVYFSDSSWKRGPAALQEEIILREPNGRLLEYDPSSGETSTLLDDLHFANGVALNADDSFVLVTETSGYRVRRYWLRGERAGTSDTFIEDLPGFPDGISANADGTFWVALFAPRNRFLDGLLSLLWLRKLVARLPAAALPSPKRIGWVLHLDHQGKILRSLQDPSGAYAPISSVVQLDDKLYLGSLTEPAIGVVAVSPR